MSKKILIVGGMGPQASVSLHARVIAERAELGVTSGADYPEIIHLSVPIVEFRDGIDHIVSARASLLKSLRRVTLRTADTVGIIACNTAHLLAEDIERATGIEFVNLPEVTARYVHDQDLSSVSILCTKTTRDQHVYDDPLGAYAISYKYPTPSQMTRCEALITSVIAGYSAEDLVHELSSLVGELTDGNQQRCVLGCTELSAIASARSIEDDRVIDPVGIGVKRLISLIA